MIGIDTNVLVRLLAGDHVGQTAAVRDFLIKRTARDPAFVSAVALMEALWVLQRRLRYPRQAVVSAIRTLMASRDFRFEHGDRLVQMLEEGEPSISDIADGLIAWSGERAGCRATLTFDQRAARAIPSMELLA